MTQMVWDDLRYVLAVVRTNTLSEAAKTLNVSVSTVARRIRTLEESVGTSLFEKVTRGVVLTTAGEQMLAVAESMETLTNNLDAKIHGLDTKLSGTIRVTSTDTLMQVWINDFRDFQLHYPEISLELTSGHQLANLTQREADVAIRIAGQAPEHLIGRKHAQLHYAVYGSEELLKQYDDDTPYEGFPWLSFDFRSGDGTDRWLNQHAPKAKVVSRVENMPVMIKAVESGWGLAVLPCLVGDASPRLKRVGDHFSGGPHLWVLSHPALRGSARIRQFVGFMGELLRRDRDLIEGRRSPDGVGGYG